jgi:hypothetical protein
MQVVGPVFIVVFAFALVHLAGATQRLVGWMTFFGATVLMTVSLIEVTFYISALNPDPAMMSSISLKLIFRRPTPLLHRRGSSSVLAAGHCSCQIPDTPNVVWISGAPTSDRFCDSRGYFSAASHAARRRDRAWRGPSTLVVGRGNRAHSSQRKNYQWCGINGVIRWII